MKEFHYRWEWKLAASPETLWPLVADTNRFDRDTGLPTVANVPRPGEALTNTRRRLRMFRFGLPLEWIEEPAEWVEPHRFDVIRNYSRGPVAQLRVTAELTPQPAGGTRLTYRVWARPANLLGYLAIPLQIGLLSARTFAQVFRRYDRLAAREQAILDQPGQRPRFPAGGQDRLRRQRQLLLDGGIQPELANRLIELIERADDLSLFRLQPYVLARLWQAPRREVLEMCLLATRQGLLDFRWDLLCPLCRVAKDSALSLGDIAREVHCDTCNINYNANFDRSVELTFRPNPAIRLIDADLEFCTSGPRAMPHVVLQQLLPAGSTESFTLQLENGRYRLRTIHLPGGRFLNIAEGGHTEVRLVAAATWPNDEITAAPEATYQLVNKSEAEQLFILERLAWTDEAVTAADVTVMQRFRDLFAEEALRPGEQVAVGNLTILFTDLRQSTRLYREIGDAPAFGLVMAHFDTLQKEIAAEDGAIVKTIGDAVMAVFRRPLGAVQAMTRVQRLLGQAAPGKRPLILKAALHHGPCIGVRLNDRFDYFGSTVNLAARLEGLSQGGDIVISEAVYQDPEVAGWLIKAAATGTTAVEPFKATLKGFAEEDFTLWRINHKTTT